MKILHLNKEDIDGGAFIAAYRIHKALKNNNLASEMLVDKSTSGDSNVKETTKSKLDKLIHPLREQIVRNIVNPLVQNNNVMRSIGLYPTKLHIEINRSDADIVHLHWINREMMSIRDISKITKPIVWTLHDMWPFSGTEHYSESHGWKDGYKSSNEKIDRLIFDMKKRYWKNNFHIITPSKWLAECAKNSSLFSKNPIHIIPNTIDTNNWKKHDKIMSRRLLNLPENGDILLFGAVGGNTDQRKGFDLLMKSLKTLKKIAPSLNVAIFGHSKNIENIDIDFKTFYLGHIRDEVTLQLIYSAADVIAIPSRQDNLPNTGIEAHSCGLPAVAFNIGGMPDIIVNGSTGFLAKPFDTEDFARGIINTLTSKEEFSANARNRAITNWSNAIIADRHLKVYEAALTS